MLWQYALVLIGSILVDIFPIPLPPAFTVMVFLQIVFHLNIWLVIFVGVTGSIIGRYALMVYVGRWSGKSLTAAKHNDLQYLKNQMQQNKKKGMAAVLLYSLMPLPTTPLFLISGMARIAPAYVILPFIVGKVISDTAAVLAGKYAAENAAQLLNGLVSWQSVTGLVLGLLLLFFLVFLDWRTLLQSRKLVLNFDIFRKKNVSKP